MENAALIAFGSVTIFEFCLVFSRPSPKLRQITAAFLLLMLGFTQAAIFYIYPGLATGAFFAIGIFRQINLMRFSLGRMQPVYLAKVVRRSSVRLFLQQIVITAAVLGLVELGVNGLIIGLSLALAANFVFVLTIAKNTRRQTLKGTSPAKTDTPTITVAIPARNETEDLALCIESVLASNYAKLEVLVLDDCSQDNTPEVIKGFAHRGVRFVDGQEPDESWLPKNAAYDKLAQEALGDYILFCGVDVRFEKDTVSRLLEIMQAGNLKMVGLLPIRGKRRRGSLLLQIARYWWELGLPRQVLNRPAALSTIFMVEKKALQDIGGFKAVRRSIMPERQFAWEFSKANGYQFLGNARPELVSSVKSATEQFATAIRVRYPQLRKRPENVVAYLIGWLTLFGLPVAAVIAGFFVNLPTAALFLAGTAIVLLLLANSLMYKTVLPSIKVAGVLTAYPVFIADLISVLVSMWRYEFGEVEWKGRNVCLPLMHISPKLPVASEN